MGEIPGVDEQGITLPENAGIIGKGYTRLRELFPVRYDSQTTFLEYMGAGLGIAGWFGVRQIGSTGAEQIGFLVWILSGSLLIVWGYHRKARGIVLINTVNMLMAASAFVALSK